jgi:hypothetical protein
LPYQPNTAFKAEIAILREKGLITENRESVKDTILKKHIELEEAF